MKPSLPRILFTGDCNYLFATHHGRTGQGPYTAQVLDDHIDLLADSGVQAYVANPNGQVPWYPSKALDHVLTGYRRGDVGFFRSHYPPLDETFTQEMLDQQLATSAAMLDRYLDLVEAGVDWLAHTAGACRRRGVTPWLSVRMNDAHGANSWDHSYFNCPPQRDPANRLSGKRIDPRREPNPFMAVCDYRRSVVRDYYMAMIRELVEEYEYEGLELDWLRMPLCCEPPATQADIDIMLDWMRQVRALTQRRASATGRPYPLGLRVPCRLGALRTMGLDVPAMAREGLIDFVGLSNFWQTSWDVPYDRLRAELGEGIFLYGVIEDAPNWLLVQEPASGARGYRLLTTSAELMRGNAAGKLATGVDGIEFFNFFCSGSEGVHPGAKTRGGRYDAIACIDNLAYLRGKPKHYALATSFNYWSPAFFEYADQLPATVEHGGWRRFDLAMCAEPPAAGMELIMQLVVARRDDLPNLGVSVNGSWPSFDATPTDELLFPTGTYTHHLPEHVGLNYRLDPAHIREGFNELVVHHGADPAMPHEQGRQPGERIVSVELAVRQGDA